MSWFRLLAAAKTTDRYRTILKDWICVSQTKMFRTFQMEMCTNLCHQKIRCCRERKDLLVWLTSVQRPKCGSPCIAHLVWRQTGFRYFLGVSDFLVEPTTFAGFVTGFICVILHQSSHGNAEIEHQFALLWPVLQSPIDFRGINTSMFSSSLRYFHARTLFTCAFRKWYEGIQSCVGSI